MRKVLLVLILCGLVFAGLVQPVSAAGPCSIFRTWTDGQQLTGADLTTSFLTVGQTNMIWACLDDYSQDVSQMRATTDPFPAGVESLATTAAGEIERIRFIIKKITGWSQWYAYTNNFSSTLAPNTSAPFTVLTTGSTVTGGSSQGLRRSAYAFFDTNTTDTDTALMTFDVVQTGGAGTIAKNAIRIFQFSQPDNGGDSSAQTVVQTGGGNGLTAYRAVGLRPAGLTNYATSGGYALESGGDTNSYHVGIFIDQFGGGPIPNFGGGLVVNIATNSTNGKGILINPQNVVFDTRQAYGIGTPNIGAADTNLKWQVLMNGSMGLGTPAEAGFMFVAKRDEIGGVSLKLIGDGVVTPAKFIRVVSGAFQIINDANTQVLLSLTDAGVPTLPQMTGGGTVVLCITSTGVIVRGVSGTSC